MCRLITVFFIFLLFIAGCADKTLQIDHYLTFSAKGTRSESRHGHLVVDGREIPWAFKQIAFEGKSYSLHLRSYLWGNDGYHPDEPPLVQEKDGPMVSPETLAKGYWLGAKRPQNIPGNWFLVTWGKNSFAYVAPHAIDTLIEEQKITVAPAEGMIGAPFKRE
ncbi:MAG: hypothetical protein JXK94_12885 [Deltaproteobacteria bacterium]|nr:hypothetical protein [Deltaproteobacteria bacterium]